MTGPRLTKIEREAEEELGHVAVCIIGNSGAVPRVFGDNLGAIGIRVVVTKDPAQAHRVDDQRNPHHEIITHCWVYVASLVRGQQLAKALNEAVAGKTEESRFSWRSLDGDQDLSMLPLLFLDAADATGIETFDETEHIRRRTQRAKQLMRKQLKCV